MGALCALFSTAFLHDEFLFVRLTASVSAVGEGVDSLSKRVKLESTKRAEKRAAHPPSAARIVGCVDLAKHYFANHAHLHLLCPKEEIISGFPIGDLPAISPILHIKHGVPM